MKTALQGIFPTQGSNPGLLHCRQILHCLSHQGNPWILDWVAYPFSRGSSQPRNWTRVSCIPGRFFTIWATRKAQIFYIILISLPSYFLFSFARWLFLHCAFPILSFLFAHTIWFCFVAVVSPLNCVQLFCNSMDYSPPGPSVHGIIQARILEWVAVSISRVSSQTRDQICISYVAGRSFTIQPLGKL